MIRLRGGDGTRMTGQIEEMGLLLAQQQRLADGAQHGSGGALGASLLEPDVVLGNQAHELRHLRAAQTGNPAPPGARKPDLLR